MLTKVITHRSVQASAAAGITLSTCSIVATLPVALWAAWAALTVVSVVQGVRAAGDVEGAHARR